MGSWSLLPRFGVLFMLLLLNSFIFSGSENGYNLFPGVSFEYRNTAVFQQVGSLTIRGRIHPPSRLDDASCFRSQIIVELKHGEATTIVEDLKHFQSIFRVLRSHWECLLFRQRRKGSRCGLLFQRWGLLCGNVLAGACRPS